SGPRARIVEVACQLGLAVDDHGVSTGVPVEVDTVQLSVMSDIEAVVDLSLPIHAVAALGLSHQGGEAVLQNSGADAREDIFSAVLFEQDRVDVLEMQKLRQQQAGRTTVDDAYLCSHGIPS